MIELYKSEDGLVMLLNRIEAESISPELAYIATILAARKGLGFRPLRVMWAWICWPSLRKLWPVKNWKMGVYEERGGSGFSLMGWRRLFNIDFWEVRFHFMDSVLS